MKVFVYGTLKKGFSNELLLENSEFIEYRTLKGFVMYNYGPYPMVFPGGGVVQGEVYEVDDYTLSRLDRLEGCPHLYQRITEDDVEIYISEIAKNMLCPVIESGMWEKEPKGYWGRFNYIEK